VCYGCYEEYGKPEITNERVEAAAALVTKIYEYNRVGSNLHIVTDDWNLEDNNIDFCLNAARTAPYHEITPEQRAVEEECCNLLRSMTLQERASVLAIHDGYLYPTRDGDNVQPA
jgi:hypothetical protein